jgi:hypothetical protein
MTAADPHDKLLNKLAGLKRMAEGAAAIGSEAEAQAFADMLQKLLLDHDLQMSDIEFADLAKEGFDREYVNFSKHGIKSKKTRTAWMEKLASMICRANFCRIVVIANSSNIWIVGRREHRAVAEYMVVTLTRALHDISKKEYARFYHECIKRDGHPTQARGFKDAFITGFLYRLFQRLEERKTAAGATSSTALMRLNHEDSAVDQEMARRRALNKDEVESTHKGRGLRLNEPTNAVGLQRGVEAADGIDLGGKAIETISVSHRRLS